MADSNLLPLHPRRLDRDRLLRRPPAGDMRLPLLYAMSWPHRLKMPWDRLDFVKVHGMGGGDPGGRKPSQVVQTSGTQLPILEDSLFVEWTWFT